MSGISKVISESLYKKVQDALKEVSRSGGVSRKLQAIKSSKEHGITAVSKIFGVSRVSIMSWIESFNRLGIEGLKLKAGRGRKAIVSDDELKKIQTWIESDSSISIKQIRLKIEEDFGKVLSVGAAHNLLKKLNFSYITPRPSHYKKNSSSHEEFKKKSNTSNPRN